MNVTIRLASINTEVSVSLAEPRRHENLSVSLEISVGGGPFIPLAPEMLPGMELTFGADDVAIAEEDSIVYGAGNDAHYQR